MAFRFNLFAPPPIVVPKVRTSTIGGETLQRSMLTIDMQRQGHSDVQWMLKDIAARDTDEQIKLNNPPSTVLVDNNKAESLEQVKRKIVVYYGTQFAAAAMRMVENVLKQKIEQATVSRSGLLRNVAGAWRWKLVTPDGATRTVTSTSPLPPFSRGVMLILEPYRVPHATVANRRVLPGGSLKSRRANRMARGQMGPPKPKQSVGFMRATVEALRARGEFRDFSIQVVFSKAFQVPGELSKIQGTASLVIRLKLATARR